MSLFKKKSASAAEEPMDLDSALDALEQESASADMDLDSVMKKYDRESNTRVWEGIPKIVVNSILAIFSVYCLVMTLFINQEAQIRLPSFMSGIILIGFLIFPVKKGKQRVNYIPWYDMLIMTVGTAAFLYPALDWERIRVQGAVQETWQMIIAIIGILILFELCRRCVGLPILIVAGFFIVYALTIGLPNEDFMGRLSYLSSYLYYSLVGIFSTPVQVCATFICVFIIFGAFLERSGIADFFINIANSVVGRFSGGPAKVAVVASALEGMVSGSSVANTVGSGAVTIPLMKKTGYKPEFAAAAEAAASTGGQIMPPIMGAAAFLMTEMLVKDQMTYGQIVLRAILPAVLYFTGIFIAVHLEAKKENLRGLTKEEMPKFKPLVKKIYLLIPMVLLVYLVTSGSNSIQYAAAISIVAVIVVSLFNKGNRITPKRIFEALAAGSQGMITVAVACGMAGIISGIITATGLASELVSIVVDFSNGNVLIALFLTMLCCIILGMGVPTTANYCIMAATCAPILVQMGVEEIAAHFFVFYFGIVADLTPPVALAAYAGAAIAQANPMKTAFTSTKLAIGAFIVPYMFALEPAMLFVGNPGVFQVIQIIATSLIGIFAISAALEGFFLSRMSWYERIISAVGGLLLVYPEFYTDIGGLALVAAIVVMQILKKNQMKARV